MTDRRELAVVVPVMLNWEGCVKMLASIDYPFYPIIIDNSVENKGVAKAWNMGLGRAMELGIGNVLVTNDDVVYAPGTMEKLLDALRTRVFTSALDKNQWLPSEKEEYDEYAEWAGFMVHPKQFVNKVGFFDEHFHPAYFEDTDMYRRMVILGMEQETRRKDALMFHDGSKTQYWRGTGNDERVVTHEAFRRNESYYKAKWGGAIGEEQFTIPFGTGQYTIKEW